MIRGGKGRERDKTKTKQAEETGKVKNTKRGGEEEAKQIRGEWKCHYKADTNAPKLK